MAGLARTFAAMARNGTPSGVSEAPPKVLRQIASFGDNPGELKMLAHVPEPLPHHPALVVVLHGCTQTAEGYADGAGWLELSDRYGFALLCPQQCRTNNLNLCFNWFQPTDCKRGQGEAASIRQMILHMLDAYGLDPQRVFVTGQSAGGAMANVMLATYPEVFAAGAIVAGLPYGAASNMAEAFAAMKGSPGRSAQAWGSEVRNASSHDGPWPRVSVWQGDQDGTVAASVAQGIASQWADVHGARRVSGSGQASGRTLEAWRSSTGETVVEVHRIAGMAHGTPLACDGVDGCGRAGPYLLDVGVSSSFEIAQTWGLVGAQRRAGGRPSASGRPPSGGTSFRPGIGLPALDMNRVITDALRSAGLMK